MYYRHGITALARSVDDAPPEWRWAWEGFVGAYVPALSHIPVGGFEPPEPYQPAASKMPDGAYLQDATAGAGIVCRITAAGIAALTRYGTTEWTSLCQFYARANPNNNQYLGALVDNNTDADTYVTAGMYSNLSGNINVVHTTSGNTFQAATGVGTGIGLNRLETLLAQKRSSTALVHRDGVLLDDTFSLSTSGTNNINTTGGICVGSGGVNARVFDVDVYVAAVWGRSFLDGEASKISADPVAMFRWQRQRAYSFAAAAAPSTPIARGVFSG